MYSFISANLLRVWIVLFQFYSFFKFQMLIAKFLLCFSLCYKISLVVHWGRNKSIFVWLYSFALTHFKHRKIFTNHVFFSEVELIQWNSYAFCWLACNLLVGAIDPNFKRLCNSRCVIINTGASLIKVFHWY